MSKPGAGRGYPATVVIAILIALLGGAYAAKELIFSGAATSYSSAEQATLQKINAARRARGLKPMRMDARLTEIARKHSHDMINRDYFSHSGFLQRARTARRTLFAENLYLRGPTNGQAIVNSSYIVQAWLHSPPHKRDMLFRDERRAGISILVGTFQGRKNTTLVTADFSS